jgi:Uncharacterized protein conserved in bacteria
MRKIGLFIAIFICILAQAASAGNAKLASVERLFLEGNYESVIKDSTAYIRSGVSQKDEFYYLKGLSELKTNRFDNARSSFNTIIIKYPRSKKLFDAYLGLGDSHLIEGDAGKALGVYNMIVAKFPADTNISIVHTRMASCYAKMGLRDKAAYYTDMAARRSPLGFETKAGPVTIVSAPGLAKTSTAAKQTVRISGSGVSFERSSVSELASGKISIQVGSFKSKRNADKLARKLAAAGYPSFVSIPVSSDDKFYRVKVGKFSSKEEAAKDVTRLQGDGYRTSICTGDLCD